MEINHNSSISGLVAVVCKELPGFTEAAGHSVKKLSERDHYKDEHLLLHTLVVILED